MTNVIKIEDARELRELGLPLLPVVDKEFSQPALDMFAEATKAKSKFYIAFTHYTKAPSERRFNRLCKAMDKIIVISNQAAQFTSAEECEASALQVLLTKPLLTFVAFWRDTLALVEQGNEITITITQEMLDEWATP